MWVFNVFELALGNPYQCPEARDKTEDTKIDPGLALLLERVPLRGN